MSGESFRAMIVRARWIVTVVRGAASCPASSASVGQPSSYASRARSR
jgi:hypothetical protein